MSKTKTLIDWMTAHGESIRDFEARSGLATNTILKARAGHPVSHAVAWKIAEATDFAVSVIDLMGAGSKPKRKT